MPFQPVPNVMAGVMHFQIGGQHAQNTYHYQKTSPASQADCQALANALLNTLWAAHLKALVTPDVALTDFTVTALDSQTAPIAVATPIPGDVNGTGAGTSVPSGSALVATFVTAQRSRNGRGRIYLAGVPSGQMADPIEVASGYLTSFLAALQFLFTIGTAVSATLVVVSRELNKIQRPTGIGIPVTGITADRLVDSQRRRLGGRGT